jgi:hypothetical protein
MTATESFESPTWHIDPHPLNKRAFATWASSRRRRRGIGLNGNQSTTQEIYDSRSPTLGLADTAPLDFKFERSQNALPNAHASPEATSPSPHHKETASTSPSPSPRPNATKDASGSQTPPAEAMHFDRRRAHSRSRPESALRAKLHPHGHTPTHMRIHPKRGKKTGGRRFGYGGLG